MATRSTKKTGTTKKKSTAKKRETKAAQGAKKQMWAVVLFAVGILVGALTMIPGGKLWLWVHNALFGLLGWSAFFVAPLVIYIAVIAAKDQPLSSIKAKLWQLGLLILMISGAIQVYSGMPEIKGVIPMLTVLYEDGIARMGGGAFGAVIAWPLLALLDATGAKIVIWLGIFVFFMLITGATLMSLYHMLARPVQELETAYANRMEERPERPLRESRFRRREGEAPPPEILPPKGTRFNIDVDITDDSNPEDFRREKEDSGFVPPLHPVTAGAQDAVGEMPPTSDGEDVPVEYISGWNHGRAQAPEETPEQQGLRHPLEEEIRRIEQEEADDLLARFGPTEQTKEQPEEPAAPEAPAPASPLPPIRPAYRRPPSSLLRAMTGGNGGDTTEELRANAQVLVDTLKSFGVQTRVLDICKGPAVTRYELQPSAGVKISRITGLADDIALNLATAGIRIEAPIPNKAAVGIEVPNKSTSIVGLRDIVESSLFRTAKSSISVALGRDIAGHIMLADLSSMPHVLIAGATGSGKSVCINSIIISLLYKSSPDEVKLLMIDPKVVELGVYNGIPHLLVPVVTDPKKSAGALAWAVSEMLGRYKTFAAHQVRDISGYNKLAEGDENLPHMPKIVIVIDELADLMMAAPSDVEDSICRLAQMARAAGMHLVIATQRPSVDVITGVIKANIPSRIAFAVSSHVDSRTILDMGGAEKLLGRGDMLYYPVGASKPVRVQGCYVSDTEVERVISYIKEGDAPEYDQDVAQEIERRIPPEKGSRGGMAAENDEDEMLPQAIECVVEMGQASTSALQRRLKLGYARAARIIDQLEQKGIVGPFEGSKPRQVLISKDQWLEMKLRGSEQMMLAESSEANSAEDMATV
jgi:DNA segregation ATPase FtsK/SpoIIIE and related proteins